MTGISQPITENPLKNCRTVEKINMKITRFASAITEMLNVFLKEYCKVRGVKEPELKNRLQIFRRAYTTSSGGLSIIEDDNKVLLGIEYNSVPLKDNFGFRIDHVIYGSVLNDEVFPETKEYINNLNKKK